MSLLGFDDVAGSSTGNGYLDIVDFILHGWQNLRELYRRVAYTEESDINILLSASVSYMLVPKKDLRLLRMFMPHQRLAQNRY